MFGWRESERKKSRWIGWRYLICDMIGKKESWLFGKTQERGGKKARKKKSEARYGISD